MCNIIYYHSQEFFRSEKGATTFFYFICSIYAKTHIGRNSILHNELIMNHPRCLLGLCTFIHLSHSFMQCEVESSDRAEQLEVAVSLVCVPYNENTTLLSYMFMRFNEKAEYIVNFDSFLRNNFSSALVSETSHEL